MDGGSESVKLMIILFIGNVIIYKFAIYPIYYRSLINRWQFETLYDVYFINICEKNLKKTFITVNQEVNSKCLDLKKESTVMKVISLKQSKVF